MRGTLPPKILAESIEKQGETTAFSLFVAEAEIRMTELENRTFLWKIRYLGGSETEEAKRRFCP